MVIAHQDIGAILFDLDGTLADTEGLYRRFWVVAAREMGYPMEDRHALMLRSMSPGAAEPLLRREVDPNFDYFAVRALRRRRMEAWMAQHPISAMPGARQVLERARQKGMLIGLVTATPRERATRELTAIGLEISCFDALACGDMVQCGKPAPDIYRLALSQLGVEAKRAVAIEDSPAGIRSARAAGLWTVMIPDQQEPDETVRALCDFVLPDLLALERML